jgi:hypothetical protein
MDKKKFIGGGFPSIKECIDEKDIMSNESREKREFSVRKIIPITQILSRNQTFNNFDQSEDFNVVSDFNYLKSDSESLNNNSNQMSSFDLDLINAPITKKISSKRSKNKRSSKRSKNKRSKNKKSSKRPSKRSKNKRSKNKRSKNKRSSKIF